MSATKSNAPQEVNEELRLLRKIDRKVDDIDAQLVGMKKQAMVYGAAAGGLSGAIAAVGVMVAKTKLGL